MVPRVAPAALALLALALPACGLVRASSVSPRSAAHARAAAIAETLRVPEREPPTLLRYAMQSGDEAWSLEIVTADGAFAERRSRGGTDAHVLGSTPRGAFLRVAARPAVWLDGGLGDETRTRAAIFGAGFARPRPGDALELEASGSARATLVHRPVGGSSIWLTIDRATSTPTSFDVVSSDDRPLRCDALAWDDRAGQRRVLAEATCTGFVSDVGRHAITLRLEERRALDALPGWAEPPSAPPPAIAAGPFEVPITDPSRLHLPATVGGKSARFVVDTGASMTTVTESQARALGVAPLPERPRHVKPPWLPTDTMWVGVIDELRFGDHAVRGQRVYVMRDDAGLGDGAAGLLGVDVLSRFVIDVDSPRGALVVRPREGFDARGAESLWVKGLSHQNVTVRGEVLGVAEGDLIVDTGAPLDAVVHHFRMSVAHPRKRGQDVGLQWGEVEVSPDYASEVDGLRIGPFDFPAMPVFARDRERDRMGGGVALIGMGLLRHFRAAFDLGHQELHLWPGDGYFALARAGVEIDERDGRAIVARVAKGSASESAGVRAGDVVRAVNGKPAGGARETTAAIARSAQIARLTVERDGRFLAAPLALR